MGGSPTDPLWVSRARAAAEHIPPGVSLLDIGCNDMFIETLLPEGTSYIPMDVCERDSRTIVADLNLEPIPLTDATFVLALGVLEYLFDLPRFLAEVSTSFDAGLLSYHPLERSPAKDRLAVGWVNALNSVELMSLMAHAGMGEVTVFEYAPSLHFYAFSKTGLDLAK